MWFGAGESIGLEFEFYGPSFAPLPQSVHAGYRRKEFLIAPLAMSEHRGRQRPYVVHTPSILAFVNIDPVLEASAIRDCECKKGTCSCRRQPRRVQLFATGQAALRIAAQPGVRDLFLEGLVNPDMGEGDD